MSVTTANGFEAGGIACGILLGLIQWGVASVLDPDLSWGVFPAGLLPILNLNQASLQIIYGVVILVTVALATLPGRQAVSR